MIAFIARQIGIALILRLAEIGQDLLVGPAGIAKLRPLIKVASIAANVKHRVENGAATDDLATCPAAAFVLHRLTGGGLWLCANHKREEERERESKSVSER